MRTLSLAARYIVYRPGLAFLQSLLLAFGVVLAVLLLQTQHAVENRLGRDGGSVDLVVGAKGSGMQLLLSSLYHVDAPTGNIPFTAVATLAQNPLVQTTVPVALGDSVAGYRIVGTTPGYLDFYDVTTRTGRLFAQPFEALLGAQVALNLGLGLADTFVGTHGLVAGGEAHASHPYTVVGILPPTGTVIDRLVFTPVESVWDAHADHGHTHAAAPDTRAITAVLVGYRSPVATLRLPRDINSQTDWQAASPALEGARLLSLFGVGLSSLQVLAGVLIVLALVANFIGLMTLLQERLYDLALLRSLGATRRKVFGLVLAIGALLAVDGALMGWVLGHGLLWGLSHTVFGQELGLVAFMPLNAEFCLILLAPVAGMVAALWPALRAYRLSVADVLSQR